MTPQQQQAIHDQWRGDTNGEFQQKCVLSYSSWLLWDLSPIYSSWRRSANYLATEVFGLVPEYG
ncbi:hypothetical protein OIDMADRAFT_21003 [Oidiodendron maius Zn]|uniref:Uncharacterized protein n=1 Tax=Oidiodendron maius (strain Zn) TaxID=913774 RepID=A0A0C3GZ87_OIDMZ|nr:hypothetical protein OIDMADRAFT_21003 [Oidiodendron maius Zn]